MDLERVSTVVDGGDERIPVTVLTGFLGSGKTTLLNALLQHPQLQDTAIIVNEFGEIGLDHLLVAGAVDNVVLLNAGCLCCTVLNSLKETLADLYHRRVKGTVPPFARVLVETTGLADPAPVLLSILRDSLTLPFFRLDGVVTTIDASLGLSQLDRHPEAMKQVAMADRLVVTKTDLTDAACPPRLKERLTELNPVAPVLLARQGIVPPGHLIGVGPWSADGRIPDVAHWLGEGEVHHHSEHPDVNRHGDIQAVSFIGTEPISWAGLAGWTDLVRRTFGDKLLRCKGILLIAETGRPVIVHGVEARFAVPQRLKDWPDGDHRSRLVCIARDIDPDLLRASFVALRLAPGTHAPSSIEDLAR